jgi:hypothetical protein
VVKRRAICIPLPRKTMIYGLSNIWVLGYG